jgi:hypothetical protein
VTPAWALFHCRTLFRSEWDEACLAFYENRAAVATPSAAQVRRPLNADAVGRWRNHEEALQPVKAWLEEQGIEIE